MARIAIVEDEKRAQETLETYLKKAAGLDGEEFSVSVFGSAIEFLTNYKPIYDIVFMDIELPGLNGMDASRKLREFDKNVTLVFVTNLAQYAVKGYEVDALDFIVKPVSFDNFYLKLQRALDRVKMNKEVSLSIPTSSGLTIISASRLKYIDVMKHSLVFHTLDGDYETYGTLKQYESKLDPRLFVRCNSCFLVNLQYVQSLKDYFVKVGGDELTISHPKKKDFVKALNEYLGRGFNV